VNVKNMRKYALAMVTMLALAVAFGVLGCGKKAEEESSTTPMESTMPDTSMMSDTTMADTTMSH